MFLLLFPICLTIDLSDEEHERCTSLYTSYMANYILPDNYNVTPISELSSANNQDDFNIFLQNLQKRGFTCNMTLEDLEKALAWSDGYAEFGLTSLFDKEKLPTGLFHLSTKEMRKMFKKDDPCGPGADPFQPISNIDSIRTVDLNTMGVIGTVRNQGRCGSCWACGTAILAEAAIRTTQDELKADKNVSDSYKKQSFNASVQYILNTSFGRDSNLFCLGGNFILVAKDYCRNRIFTVENTSDYPYESYSTEGSPMYEEILRPLAIIHPLLIPFQPLPNLSTVLIRLHDTQGKTPSMTVDVVRRVKSYIARGIPVAATINTQSSPEAGQRFYEYRGGILKEPCLDVRPDHQVVYVGYGYYKGVEVWMLRNSWGEKWGVHGNFYVPIGVNAFCVENYAYTALPTHYPLSKNQTVYQRPIPPLNQSSDGEQWETKIIRGKNGMDTDDSLPKRNSNDDASDDQIYAPTGIKLSDVIPMTGLTTWQIALIVTGSILLIGTIIGLIIGLLCRRSTRERK
ncbi:Cathepsin L [Giardia muris]|uniref:Cathepsin L n=1 Tax=Giardia muris TaxID=5742 RepID=A0A4Z1T9F1_GIAMU|nr:Cathepsin L [Giardia muris]|eukprot:TNJ29777.1 Cathepsin L [Giardia muris]